MSRLIETRRAHIRLTELLDQEIRKNRSGSSARELDKFHQTLDAAFYLLGWAQFEHLVRTETNSIIEEQARAQTIGKYAWDYMKQHLADVPVRRRLDLLFHSKPVARNKLHKNYDIRNDITHEYKPLPPEAKDISAWLEHLQDLVDNF